MPLVKFCILLVFQLLISLLPGLPAISQSYIYTDRELLFDASKDHMKVLLSPDGSTHVWRWGIGRVTMDVYDKQLRRTQSRIVSRSGERILFTEFKNFYYALLMESKTTRLLCVKNNDWVDRTADFNKIPLEEAPVSQIRQGEDQWVFIQYSSANDDEHSMMHITAVDSNLQYVNSMHLTLRYPVARLRNLRIHTLGNDLLLINTAIEETTAKMTIHKVNVVQGTVRSNSFLFDDEMFFPQEVLPYKTGFILQGQANRPLHPPRKQTAYTYLLQLDSSLQQVSRFYTALEDSSLAANSLYLYLPVSTTILPNNQLLITDYRRNMNFKTKVFETQLRFNRLDSAFTTMNSFVQPTVNYSHYPSLVFSNGRHTMVYYEEEIKHERMIVHSFQLGDMETDRLLQLNPKQRYLLKSAIRTSSTSFIMPYLRNYWLGLVRVNVPVEQAF